LAAAFALAPVFGLGARFAFFFGKSFGKISG